MKKILFYDRVCVNFRKYIPDIIDTINKDKNLEMLLAYDEEEKADRIHFAKKGIKTYKTKLFEKHHKIIDKFKPDLLLVNAQRISDSSLVVYAKKLGIKTIMIQHGMYIPFMKRESAFFVKKLFMIFRYIFYTFSISRILGLPFLKTLKTLYNIYVKGDNYNKGLGISDEINTDYVFVYGEYWKEYHNVVFGYNHDCQHVIGYHELKRIEDIKKRNFEEKSICYIAQTLVEDGRFEEKEFEDFISILHSLTKKFKVYIKTHPRSNPQFYDKDSFIVLENDIPNCEYYLGHYSSLLALFPHLEGTLITWEFLNHAIPDYFSKISKKVSSESELIEILENYKSNNSTNDFDFYFNSSYSTKRTVELIYKLGFTSE